MLSNARFAAVLAAALALAAAPAAPAAVDPRLDLTYGAGGATTAQVVPGVPNTPTSLAVRSDGRVVVGGYAGTGPTTAFVARLDQDGGIDSSFANGAVDGVSAVEPVPVRGDHGVRREVRVLLTPDERVLVLGSALVRLTADGVRDPAFGSGGRAALPAGFTGRAVALQPDGSIVVAGTRPTTDGTQAVVCRLTPDGVLDTGFGQGGLAAVPPGVVWPGEAMTLVSLRGIAVDQARRVVVAGFGRATGYPAGFLARLAPNGALDPSFGPGGGFTAVESAFEPSTLGVDGPGRVAIAGELFGEGGGHGSATVSTPQAITYGEAGEQRFPSHSRMTCFDCRRHPGSLTALADGTALISSVGTAETYTALWPNQREHHLILARTRIGARAALPAVAELPAGTHPTAITVAVSGGKVLTAGTEPGGFVVARLLIGASPVVVVSRRLRRAGRVRPMLRCVVRDGCRGEVRVTVRNARGRVVVLGRGRFAIRAGQRKRVALKVSRAALSRRRATVTVRPTRGAKTSAAVKIAT